LHHFPGATDILSQQAGHIFRQWEGKGQHFPRNGVAEGQKGGVQSGAGDQVVIFGAVEEVPGKGVAQMGHVDADLVGAPGVQIQTQQRTVVFLIQNPVVSPGGLSVDANHLLYQRIRLGAKGGIDRPGCGGGDALTDRKVTPAEVIGVELVF
jgi:hypothetical protein